MLSKAPNEGLKRCSPKTKTHLNLHHLASFPGCLESCVGQGISGAGVRRGGDCFCLADFPNEEKLLYVDEDQCREPCKGDPAFFCGGASALHIYIASEWLKHFLTFPTSVSNGVAPVWGQLLPGGFSAAQHGSGGWRPLSGTGCPSFHAWLSRRVGLG